MAAYPMPQRGIIPAKVSMPSLRGVLPRQRLFDALDNGRAGAAIWVTGPAGAGKTTLIASYLEQQRLPHVWCRVDEGDADVAAFFYYLGVACQNAVSRKRKSLPLLTAEYMPGLQTFARRYFRDLYERLEGPFVVVLDNYQMLPTDSLVHQVVRVAMEEVPETGCVIAVSREPPHEAFTTFIAGRTMAVLAGGTLALTLDETRAVLTSWGHEEVPEEDVRLIHDSTQGWVAGVVLLREQFPSMKRQLLSTGMAPKAVVFDYFAGEVFRALERSTQDFLLRTAFFPEMTAGMAMRLTGAKKAGDLLHALNRRNYFTERHRSKGAVYQYHALFREFLLEKAAAQFSAKELSQVQISAAELLEEAGQPEAAFDLFRAAGSVDRQADMIIAHAPALVVQGRNATLDKWFASLPDGLLAESGDLLFWQGATWLSIDPAAARGSFERAFRRYEDDNARVGMLLSWAAIVDTFLYEWGDFEPLDRWIEIMDTLSAEGLAFFSPQVEARVSTGMVNALFFRQPQHRRLPAWAEKLEQVLFSISDANEQVIVGSRLAQYFATVGRFAAARRLLWSLAPRARKPSTSPLARLTWFSVRAIHDWLACDEDAFEEAVAEGLALSRNTGVHVLDYFLLSQRVYGRLSVGNLEGAREDLTTMGELLIESRRLDAALYHYLHAWQCALEEDWPQAQEHLSTALRNAGEAGVPFVEGLIQVAMAQCSAERGDGRAASTYLRSAMAVATGMKSSHLSYMCHVTAAAVAFEQGKERKGTESLTKAFKLGRREGFVNFGWWLPQVMTRLCAKALAAQIEVEYAQGMIVRRALRPDPQSDGPASWPWPVKIVTLGLFSVLLDGQELPPPRRARQKPLELLKALIALGGQQVPESRLADLLWPDAEGDAALHTLGITLYRLRKLLGQRLAIERIGHTLSLRPTTCWVDVWEFERLNKLAEDARFGSHLDRYKALAHQALELYGGPFLPKDAGAFWAVALRERSRETFIRCAISLAARLEADRAWHEAAALHKESLVKEPLAERLWRGLVALYGRNGLQQEAARAYQQCIETFRAEGATPSFRLEDISRSARA